jgi:16S rRNA (guanine527-N7)-methyltransferase
MIQSRFIEELNQLGIVITDLQLKQLNTYYELLVEYNKVMNLTGITEKEEVYLKHFYDSLTIVKAIDLNKVSTLCDMGTGAGFPGLVLKIVFPNLKVTLVDSLNKRINFLNEVIIKLGLDNIETIHDRMEEYGKNNRDKFDVVTARAVAQTNILLEYALPMVKINGYFIPLKGNMLNENDYTKACQLLNCSLDKKIEFKLPVENSDRTILVFKKNGYTNKKYPRKNSEIKKNPL